MPIKKLLKHQTEVADELSKTAANIKKDSKLRKTADYVTKKREFVNGQWEAFQNNHDKLEPLLKADHEYIRLNYFQQVRDVVTTIERYLVEIQANLDSAASKGILQTPREGHEFDFNTSVNPVQTPRRANMILNRQMVKLRMLSSVIRNAAQPVSPEMALVDSKYCRNEISTQWRQIQELHETILCEETLESVEYENSGKYEDMEVEVKRIMTKLQQIIERAKTPHSHTRLPPVTIPTFSGDYESWTSFHDVHEDHGLSKLEMSSSPSKNAAQPISPEIAPEDDKWELFNQKYNKRKLAEERVQSLEMMAEEKKEDFPKASECSEVLSTQGTTWHFTPLAAPHFGGLWEAGVKSVVNSRSLGGITKNSENTIATPGHLTTGRSLVTFPDRVGLDEDTLNWCLLITTVQSASHSIKHPTSGLYEEHIGHAVLDRGVPVHKYSNIAQEAMYQAHEVNLTVTTWETTCPWNRNWKLDFNSDHRSYYLGKKEATTP